MDLKYRSKTDIVASILESANGNWVIQTKVIYNAFLSHRQLKEYIPFLVENSLLEYNPDNQTYKTTKKGMKLITLYNKMKEYVKELED